MLLFNSQNITQPLKKQREREIKKGCKRERERQGHKEVEVKQVKDRKDKKKKAS